MRRSKVATSVDVLRCDACPGESVMVAASHLSAAEFDVPGAARRGRPVVALAHDPVSPFQQIGQAAGEGADAVLRPTVAFGDCGHECCAAADVAQVASMADRVPSPPEVHQHRVAQVPKNPANLRL